MTLEKPLLGVFLGVGEYVRVDGSRKRQLGACSSCITKCRHGEPQNCDREVPRGGARQDLQPILEAHHGTKLRILHHPMRMIIYTVDSWKSFSVTFDKMRYESIADSQKIEA